MQFIRITCPCIEYPLKPHFNIVKLGYEGVYLFFLFLLQNIKVVLMCTQNLCFEQKYEKYPKFSAENFQFLQLKDVRCQ